MRDGLRATRLRDEILRLSGRGWSLEDGRTRFEAVMSYPLSPRWYEIVEFLLGMLGGGGSANTEMRGVRIWVDEDGILPRRTISDLPPRPHRRGRAWEVADTDGPAVRTTFDGYIPPAE